MQTKQTRSLAMFLIPSIVGILIFMIPVRFQGTWTIMVKILADFISSHLETILPLLCVLILTISSVMAAAGLAGASFIHKKPLLKECFSCAPVWVAVRCLGCLFAWLTFLGVGGDNAVLSAISGPDQGGVALVLIVGLVIIFAIASFLLPLLLDFGLLEFVGALLTKFMRPLFRVPGRAAVDCITSWIGDGTLGVMLTCNQYEGGLLLRQGGLHHLHNFFGGVHHLLPGGAGPGGAAGVLRRVLPADLPGGRRLCRDLSPDPAPVPEKGRLSDSRPGHGGDPA